MDNNGAVLLAAAILKLAKLDYKIALENNDKKETAKLERFFLSMWGQELSDFHGQLIIDRVRNEVKKLKK